MHKCQMKGISFNMLIEILMSTYNGEKYIKQQIDSIMQQKAVDVHISIRDDGSTDNSVECIKNMMELYPGKITLFEGENIGYRRSFLMLLKLGIDADYYGFADQDDYWKSDKLYRAIECLKSIKDDIKLYASSLEIVDTNMDSIGENNISRMPKTLESYFTRSRLAGCTFVFSKACKCLAQKFSDIEYPDEMMPDHDFVVGTCAFACGNVYLDDRKEICHIRHEGSVTSGGNGIKKRIQTEWKLIFRRKNVRSTMAKEMIVECSNELSENAKKFFDTVVDYQTSMRKRIKLLFNKKMTSGMIICDMEQKLKIILGTY